MPITAKAIKVPTMGAGWYPPDHPRHVPGLGFNTHAERNLRDGQKVPGFRFVHALSGLKHRDQDGYDRNHPSAFGWKAPRTTSKGTTRKMASAMIAKIPLPLSRHIAKTYHPQNNN